MDYLYASQKNLILNFTNEKLPTKVANICPSEKLLCIQ